MNNEQLSRTLGLLGDSYKEILDSKTIMVIGIGGVGGTALEALARTGFKNLIIVDGDEVSLSNLNRQILYTSINVGQPKVQAAKERLLAINPEANVVSINQRVSKDNIDTLNEYKIDFIVDAIDDVQAKVEIAKFASKNNIPMICSLGMANKLDPTKVTIVRLDKTTNDPLAKKLRYEYKQAGVDTKSIMTVFSNETPNKDGTKLNSIMSVPSAAGLGIASYVIDFFQKEENK